MQQNARLPVEMLVSMYNLIEVLIMKGAHPETGARELLVAILPEGIAPEAGADFVSRSAADRVGTEGREGEVAGHPVLQLRQREPPTGLGSGGEREGEEFPMVLLFQSLKKQ